MEECFEIISGEIKDSIGLWKWVKPYLQKRTNMYGNLYTKSIAAAQVVGDSYATQLEQEFIDWKQKVGLS